MRRTLNVITGVALVSGVFFLASGAFAGDTNDAKAKDDKAKIVKVKGEKKVPAKKDPDEIGNRDVGKGVNFYSIEKEIGMGKSLAQDIERQAKIIDDPVIAEYVNRVGQNLVRNSDAKVPFTIKVVDTNDVNAFALPGGFFFVNSGLILKTESDSTVVMDRLSGLNKQLLEAENKRKEAEAVFFTIKDDPNKDQIEGLVVPPVVLPPPVQPDTKQVKAGSGEGFVDRIRNLFKDWL